MDRPSNLSWAVFIVPQLLLWPGFLIAGGMMFDDEASVRNPFAYLVLLSIMMHGPICLKAYFAWHKAVKTNRFADADRQYSWPRWNIVFGISALLLGSLYQSITKMDTINTPLKVVLFLAVILVTIISVFVLKVAYRKSLRAIREHKKLLPISLGIAVVLMGAIFFMFMFVNN